MFKRMVCVFLLAVFAFSLASCGKKEEKLIQKIDVDTAGICYKVIENSSKTKITLTEIEGIGDDSEEMKLCFRAENRTDFVIKYRVENLSLNKNRINVREEKRLITNSLYPKVSDTLSFFIPKENFKKGNNVLSFVITGKTPQGDTIFVGVPVMLTVLNKPVKNTDEVSSSTQPDGKVQMPSVFKEKNGKNSSSFFDSMIQNQK